ncbi:MAG TPA: response regulator transcription factor [Terriglobales bacterium]
MVKVKVTSPIAPSEDAVRILVADDHEVMRLGIRNLLEAVPNWTICGEAVNGQEAVDKTLACEPDIVIMDITMPVMNGLEASKTISRSRPDIPVILFSLHLSDEMIKGFDTRAIKGAVNKGNAARDLVEAVNRVLKGNTFFPHKQAMS